MELSRFVSLWLCSLTSFITENVEFHENNLSVSEAVVVGWTALRGVIRSWCVRCGEDLEPFLGEGTTARVAAGQRGRCARFRDSGVAHGPTRTSRGCCASHWSNTRSTGQPRSVTNCWSYIVNLADIFLERVPVLMPSFREGSIAAEF